MTSLISVVICTYNPRESYLNRTLAALYNQTLPKTEWELIIVDNNSCGKISDKLDPSRYDNIKVVIEKQVGIAHARIRGMKEAKSDLLLFVDDDNVLEEKYLEKALQIAYDFPQMGVFGGQLIPEFEAQPANELKPYLSALAIREFERDKWCNFPLDSVFNPVTAGMCLRRSVAQKHIQVLASRKESYAMGSIGKNMNRGEDDDICYTAGEMGVGVGIFTSLKLTHLIPAERVTQNYLVSLHEGIVFSGYVLSYIRGKFIRPPYRTWRWRIGVWWQLIKMSQVEKCFAQAKIRAEQRACEAIQVMEESA
jgi:glycosyltransferase involved in cell wall biosynthesis